MRISRIGPAGTAAAVVLALAGCGQSGAAGPPTAGGRLGSPSAPTSAAGPADDRAARADLRAVVATVQQCYADNANRYPTTADIAVDAVRFDCGSDQLSAPLHAGVRVTYRSTADGFAVSTRAVHGTKTNTYSFAAGGTIS